MQRLQTRVIAGLLLVVGLAIGACSDSQSSSTPNGASQGETRTFEMGFSSLPSELTSDSYDAAFERTASAGETILIRRAPPWEELLSGSDFPSDKTSDTIRREKDLADEHDLDVFFAIDATSVSADTGQLAGLPEDLPGIGFDDDAVRDALSRYAQYIVVNYEPEYLALGVDVNQFWLRDPARFQQFVTLYKEIYAEIEETSPDTLVFPTFQLEDMQGLLPLDNPHPPQWELIDEFAGSLDLLAVSTYPGVVFAGAGEIPNDYFTTLSERANAPVAISETGFATDAAASGSEAQAEREQSSYVRRVLRDADRTDMALVVWFTGQDPTFSAQLPTDLVRDSGLVRQDGTEKPAWGVWSQVARRPLPSG